MDEANSRILPTRRSVLRGIGLAACAGVTLAADSQTPASQSPGVSALHHDRTFVDLLRSPDQATAYVEEAGAVPLTRSGNAWHGNGIALVCEDKPGELPLTVTAASPLLRIHLRWKATLPEGLSVLGDAWERSYGDLGWRGLVPERPMPWYFLTFDGRSVHAYGVRTGACALAFWQCDPEGISLWLDLRNGGKGVLLGSRTLSAATVLARQGHPDESAFANARTFCAMMCPQPRLLPQAVYGSNDWYYAYGDSSATDILRDASLMAELAPQSGPRPFTIADEGWKNIQKFPDMADLAAKIHSKSVRPGLWVRPLRARGETDTTLLLPSARFGAHSEDAASNRAYDPTIPEARDKALEKVRQAVSWKYELVKHDFTTFDLLGQWGSTMGASPTLPGWSFHDRSKTNAEIIRQLYQEIRTAAGEQTIILGCNVIGHLSAGIFELQRTGDDVSGRNWERTRRMGVNTLAFRLPQHRTFFTLDADCVPFTKDIPWSLTKSWLSAVATTGTALLVSPSPDATGAEQKQAIREAFGIVASPGATARPEDWLLTRTPQSWRIGDTENLRYEWLESGGAWPFAI
ncbi:MAG: hypothetical protein HIU93_11380 [Acidobacteria bacterium]|nr:hypothetical protein [Acidobacteriota bacterium]MBW4045836.1 hypothetical protein [Acidobacteriota bacterium]